MIKWLHHLPPESLNLLFIALGGLAAFSMLSDLWLALQINEDDDDTKTGDA